MSSKIPVGYACNFVSHVSRDPLKALGGAKTSLFFTRSLKYEAKGLKKTT